MSGLSVESITKNYRFSNPVIGGSKYYTKCTIVRTEIVVQDQRGLNDLVKFISLAISHEFKDHKAARKVAY